MQRLSTLRTIQSIITALVILGWLLPTVAQASGPIMFDPGNSVGVVQDEAAFGAVGVFTSDPTGALTLDSTNVIPTPVTRQDYIHAYNTASVLLNLGVQFRSQELQRLDPATCVAQPENPNACNFSVGGIQNNYLDFDNGRLYWRFCADYDEPYVGVGAVPQNVDDPQNRLKLDPLGYCPTWDPDPEHPTLASLSADQKGRRVTDQKLTTNGQPVDIRDKLLDAQRIFAFLAVAEP